MSCMYCTSFTASVDMSPHRTRQMETRGMRAFAQYLLWVPRSTVHANLAAVRGCICMPLPQAGPSAWCCSAAVLGPPSAWSLRPRFCSFPAVSGSSTQGKFSLRRGDRHQTNAIIRHLPTRLSTWSSCVHRIHRRFWVGAVLRKPTQSLDAAFPYTSSVTSSPSSSSS